MRSRCCWFITVIIIAEHVTQFSKRLIHYLNSISKICSFTSVHCVCGGGGLMLCACVVVSAWLTSYWHSSSIAIFALACLLRKSPLRLNGVRPQASVCCLEWLHFFFTPPPLHQPVNHCKSTNNTLTLCSYATADCNMCIQTFIKG